MRITFVAAAVAVWIATVYRALTYPFTHDESLSFAIISWAPRWSETVNNHPLNTLLMRGSAALFGTSELALRLPNVLALILYLTSALLLLRRLPHPLTQLAGLVLLLLNPYVLDFFAIARGYGLGLAFLMASLWLLIRGLEGDRWSLYAAAVAAALAVMANLVFANFFAPLLLVAVLLMVRRKQFVDAAVMTATGGALLIMIGLRLVALQNRRLLSFGSDLGFISSTVRSLVECTLYVRTIPVAIVNLATALVVATFFALIGAALWRRAVSPFSVMLTILAIAVVLPIFEHAVAGTLYPLDRAALYYIPLFALTLVFALSGRVAIVVSVVLVFLGAAHFARAFDPLSSYTWWYDAHDREVLEIVESDRAGKTVQLGISWVFEPSMNHYRYTRQLAWLRPIRRARITGREDYVYGFRNDVPPGRHVLLAEYPDTHTVLVRLTAGPRATPRPRPLRAY